MGVNSLPKTADRRDRQTDGRTDTRPFCDAYHTQLDKTYVGFHAHVEQVGRITHARRMNGATRIYT